VFVPIYRHNRFRYNKELVRIGDIVIYSFLVIDLESWAVFGPRLAVIVDAGGGDIGVAEPPVNLRDVGLMVGRIGGG
jgi:hypothetical protein